MYKENEKEAMNAQGKGPKRHKKTLFIPQADRTYNDKNNKKQHTLGKRENPISTVLHCRFKCPVFHKASQDIQRTGKYDPFHGKNFNRICEKDLMADLVNKAPKTMALKVEKVKKRVYGQNGNTNKTENLKRNSGAENTTEMKNSLRGFKGRFEQTEVFVNLKIGQWKLSRLRNRKKKE